MHIENELKLDFKDVLIRPKRSTLSSRKDVLLERTFTFKHTGKKWTGVPIIAANMDTVGTFSMFNSMFKFKALTALHKHYDVDSLVCHFTQYSEKENDSSNVTNLFERSSASEFSFYSMGITDNDYLKFQQTMEFLNNSPKPSNSAMSSSELIQMVCIDVANGYTENFVSYIQKVRKAYPELIIMAGNVVTDDMTEALILAGADIVKVGIGPGSVCTTRKMTGVGYPQLSAIIECADAAHGLGGLVCADGGCTVPGDLAKAFGGGADFVMLGGMLAGHFESGGELVVKENGEQVKVFYGMSSETAMEQYSGGVASYKASEGKTVEIPYRGHISQTIQSILGGIRSACSYVGASSLKELSKRTTFIRVTQQINDIFK